MCPWLSTVFGNDSEVFLHIHIVGLSVAIKRYNNIFSIFLVYIHPLGLISQSTADRDRVHEHSAKNVCITISRTHRRGFKLDISRGVGGKG